MTEEEQKINLENASSLENALVENTPSAKKPRKQYEWTPKRKEAFEKMRKGLDEKIKLTKKLKDEKKRSEKEAIKAKVREIMNSKKGALPEMESDSSESESSESEMEQKKTKSKKKKGEKAPPVKAEKKGKSKRKQVESSEESESESSESENDEELELARQRDRFSSKQRHQYQKDKVERGKAVKVAQFVNPLDQFILL